MEPTIGDASVWVEVSDAPASRYVRIAGCVSHRRDKDQVETVVKSMLVRSPYADYRVRNEVLVDR